MQNAADCHAIAQRDYNDDVWKCYRKEEIVFGFLVSQREIQSALRSLERMIRENSMIFEYKRRGTDYVRFFTSASKDVNECT